MGFTGGDAGGVDVLRPVGNAQMGEHGAVLLRQTRHVERRDAFAVEMRGHADQRAEGDHAHAADTGDQQVVGLAGARQGGAGSSGQSPRSAAATPFFRLPPSMLTKLGQKPLRQEKSWLQADWSICRLLPKAVSTGVTDRQLDCTEQSPQPSQTASLMNTRWSTGGSLPRLRRRRASVAHIWS
jgi:hypothetical protein